MRTLVRMLTVSLLATATSLQAVTYIVPTDRDLIKRAEAIVVATALESHSELTSDGRIVTIATLALDDVIKGELDRRSSIDVVEIGGVVGDRATFVPGSPRYVSGKHYLVFLRRTTDGWATYGFGLGQFEFSNDPFGRQIVSRAGVEGIFGWDEASNGLHVERVRDAIAFQTFVKTVVDNPGAPARADYFVRNGETVAESFSYAPKPAVSVPGGLDGQTAIAVGAGNWTGAGAGVQYGVGTSNPSATGGLSVSDGISAVLFNDPAGIVPPSVAAIGGITSVSGQFTTEADVVIGKNFNTNQATFNGLMTHELGHTLGLRHSDQNTSSNGPCMAPLNCSSSAIMNSTIAFNLQSLQQWDLDAIRTVYAGQAGNAADYLAFTRWQSPSKNFDYCFAPTISGQPSSTSIPPGGQITLNVAATGTSITYQWYVGNPPSTATTAQNGTTSSLTVSPSSTTTYWVRVRACGGSQDSNGATVSVVACVAPSAPAPNASPSSISNGQSSTLSVSPTGTAPFTYQWFQGTSGDTSNPIAGTNSSISVSPTVTTSYWVRVTGQCGSPSNSPATLVTVTCSPIASPGVTAQPSTINAGQSSTLFFSTTGSGPFTIQWYAGALGDISNPIPGATTTSIVVSPTVTSGYWVRVTASCGSQDASVIVFVNGTVCTPVSITTHPGAATIPPGSSTTLNVVVAGTAPITYQWYTGTSGDLSHPITNATNASLTVTPTSTITTYWVHVSNSCNTVGVNSTTGVVTLSASCPAPSITTQPLGVSAPIGTAATLKVVATSSGAVHYQWYKGLKGDLSTKVGTDSATFVTPTVSVTANYWVRVTAACSATSFTDSNTAIVIAIATPRGRAVKH